MPRLRTLRDLQESGGGAGSDDEDGPKPPSSASNPFFSAPSIPPDQQAFYAGGSEYGGGQQVLGPANPRGPRPGNSDRFVESLFEHVRHLGAAVVKQDEGAGSSTKRQTFSGTGRRLGTEAPADPGTTAEEAVAALTAGGASTGARAASPSSTGPSPPRQVVITLWADGFSVDDGPLRDYHSEDSVEFLDSLKAGHIPRELIESATRADGEIMVDLKDRRFEEFASEMAAAKKSTVRAFVGHGHRLGGLDGTTDAAATPVPVPTPTESDAPADTSFIKVDASQPTTNIQVRLADGSRLLVHLNHTHTVTDLRQYIVASRPQYAATTFILLTTFPNREISDGDLSIKDANLLGSVVVQKLVN